MSRKYYITEVFCEGPYSGNQLATVVDTEGLTAAEMQQIARAFNFSETTFYSGGSESDGFDVRIFTPATELPFAGHPTLGSAYLIRNHIVGFETLNLTLNLGVGPISVSFAEDGVVWMQQNQPSFDMGPDKESAASMIGVDPADLAADFDPQLVSTGLEFLIIPLKNLAALRKAKPIAGMSQTGILAFCAEGYRPSHAFAARMFAPDLGVSEDAATGSANGCLAAYLVEHAYLGKAEVDAVVGQGFEISRPSALHLRASKQEKFIVEVGGQVNLVAQGEWLL
ncbi:MAG: trans-2,3-dihydro-3-hydroxyanthranilate isomerase [Candidatus Azotimanducaceae bacterium]|jgi:trans-2,3-dihydro-3-hydroxyanthranilate isomerase